MLNLVLAGQLKAIVEGNAGGFGIDQDFARPGNKLGKITDKQVLRRAVALSIDGAHELDIITHGGLLRHLPFLSPSRQISYAGRGLTEPMKVFLQPI